MMQVYTLLVTFYLILLVVNCWHGWLFGPVAGTIFTGICIYCCKSLLRPKKNKKVKVSRDDYDELLDLTNDVINQDLNHQDLNDRLELITPTNPVLYRNLQQILGFVQEHRQAFQGINLASTKDLSINDLDIEQISRNTKDLAQSCGINQELNNALSAQVLRHLSGELNQEDLIHWIKEQTGIGNDVELKQALQMIQKLKDARTANLGNQ